MKRVAVTGLGVISPVGNDVPTFWNALCSGTCGIGPITKFDATDYPVKLAAEVRDFDPKQYMEKLDILHSDVYTHFAMAAACQAVADSGIAERRRKRVEDGESEAAPSDRAAAKPTSGTIVPEVKTTELSAENEAKLSATVLCGMPENSDAAGEPLGYLVYGKETNGGLPECGFLPIPSERTRKEG